MQHFNVYINVKCYSIILHSARPNSFMLNRHCRDIKQGIMSQEFYFLFILKQDDSSAIIFLCTVPIKYLRSFKI